MTQDDLDQIIEGLVVPDAAGKKRLYRETCFAAREIGELHHYHQQSVAPTRRYVRTLIQTLVSAVRRVLKLQEELRDIGKYWYAPYEKVKPLFSMLTSEYLTVVEQACDWADDNGDSILPIKSGGVDDVRRLAALRAMTIYAGLDDAESDFTDIRFRKFARQLYETTTGEVADMRPAFEWLQREYAKLTEH